MNVGPLRPEKTKTVRKYTNFVKHMPILPSWRSPMVPFHNYFVTLCLFWIKKKYISLRTKICILSINMTTFEKFSEMLFCETQWRHSVKTRLYKTPPLYSIVFARSVKTKEVMVIEFHRIGLQSSVYIRTTLKCISLSILISTKMFRTYLWQNDFSRILPLIATPFSPQTFCPHGKKSHGKFIEFVFSYKKTNTRLSAYIPAHHYHYFLFTLFTITFYLLCLPWLSMWFWLFCQGFRVAEVF